MSEIRTMIEAEIDKIAAIYADCYRQSYREIADYRKRTGRSGFNDTFMHADAQMAARVTRTQDGMSGTEYLSRDLLADVSQRDAEAIIARYAAKVEDKANGLFAVSVSSMDIDGSFIVRGRKAGHLIEIRQSIVTARSGRGGWFIRFPALIYIDGKKSSEKALKAL